MGEYKRLTSYLEVKGKAPFKNEAFELALQNLVNKKEDNWGRGEGNNGKGHQRTCIKDPWTKPKGGRTEGGRWEWMGWGRAVGGK